MIINTSNIMSYRLYDLQDISEKNGPEYFIGPDRMVCLHSTMYAVNDAMKLVDDINYKPSEVINASSGLVTGL